MNSRLIDTLAHILLYLGLGLGAVLLLRARYSSGQFLIIMAMVAFYIAWGVVYHFLRRDLKVKLLVEYLVIASIALVVGLLVFVI